MFQEELLLVTKFNYMIIIMKNKPFIFYLIPFLTIV
jgi:hypothetical protein